jgi:phosphoribosyl 1,2-cyclic phosphodiesterase
MKLRFWGTRGSVPTPGPGTTRYGGNTSCVEVVSDDPRRAVVLDAGSGIRPLGDALPAELERVDLLLTHLHMDHIVGLGFFAPLFRPDVEVHLWGPGSTAEDLGPRLARYLSPPLFPVRVRDLPNLQLHELSFEPFEIPGLQVRADLVTHPGPTVGYRLDDGRTTVAYLPDHEPALGTHRFPERREWTSGYSLAAHADVLIHDAQYSRHEYPEHVGWGHSSIDQALDFATLADVSTLVAFHHDPSHDDDALDALYRDAARGRPFDLVPAREGETLDVVRSARLSA